MIKTLHNDLLEAQENIKKYKDEKFFLENLLRKKVEEVVLLKNKIKDIENKNDKSYSSVLKTNLMNPRQPIH